MVPHWLGNGQYCYPLTVTDHALRFLLLSEALESMLEDSAFTAFEPLFRECALPAAIHSDNGVPFASWMLCSTSRSHPPGGCGSIAIQRIRPGHPQKNGRHERLPIRRYILELH